MSPQRQAQHFATGNKPSRISLPLQCIGTDCYNRVAGSGKVSGPGCRDCGAPTPHTRTRIVRFRDHTKVGVQAKDQYFDFFIAPDFFWCSRHWELCWNWHQRHRGEVDSLQLLFFLRISSFLQLEDEQPVAPPLLFPPQIEYFPAPKFFLSEMSTVVR